VIAVVAIAGGYAALIWQFGWWGVAAAAVHLIVMGAATRR
jgi:hypothetical protein